MLGDESTRKVVRKAERLNRQWTSGVASNAIRATRHNRTLFLLCMFIILLSSSQRLSYGLPTFQKGSKLMGYIFTKQYIRESAMEDVPKHQPPAQTEPRLIKKARLYAPHVKVGNRWIRATWPATELIPEHPMSAYKKETAVRLYQNWLLASALGGTSEERSLRPIK